MKKFGLLALLCCGFVLLLYAAEINAYLDIVRQSAPSNPASGRLRLYANDSTGDLACLDSSGGDCLPVGGSSFSMASGFRIEEDFIGGSTSTLTVGEYGWQITGSATVPVYLAAEAGAPGILRRDTSSTSGVVAVLALGASGSGTGIHPSDTFDLTWRIRLNTNDTDTTVRAGLNCGATSGDPPADGIYFEKLAADTNWFRITRASSTETRTSHGVAVSTSFVKMRIRRKDGSTISFSINGGAEADVTTNITTAGCRPFTHIKNSAAAAKTLDHDYFYMLVSGLSR